MDLGLTYADILLEPDYSNVSRKRVRLNTEFVKGVFLSSPFVVSPMLQNRSHELATAVLCRGGMFVLDRFFPVAERAKWYSEQLQHSPDSIAVAVGAHNALEDAKVLYDAGARIFAIDVAHGASEAALQAISDIKKHLKDAKVIGGNVATYFTALQQIYLGVDAVRVGFGNGSICVTRIKTGVGVPQYTALKNCYAACGLHGIPMIADGGFVEQGDFIKAFHAGASSCWMGRQFVQCVESAAEIETDQFDGKEYKRYFGMASNTAADELGVDRFLSEGVEDSLIPCNGSVNDMLTEYMHSLASGMAYIGALTLSDIKDATAIQVSHSALTESYPHDIVLRSD